MLRIILPFLLLLVISGCSMNPEIVDSWKSELPRYMQKNLGPIQSEISLRCIFSVSWVEDDEIIHLCPFTTKEAFFHECMHSFEVNRLRKSPKEYEKFLSEYQDVKYDIPLNFLCFVIPLHWIPAKGAPNMYALTNHWENSAETFRFWIIKKRTNSDIVKNNLKVIERFVTGEFSNEDPLPQ